MVATLSTPGVYVQFVDPPAGLDPVAVDVAAFVGVFERGPVDVPVRIASWPQVQATFGGFIPNGIGAYALKAWVDNGGRVAHVVRVAAPLRQSHAVGVQPADRRSSLLSAVDGLVVGAGAAVQQAGKTWLHLVADVDVPTARATWDRPLHPDLDLALPFTVSTGSAAAAATLVDDAATPVLAISAASPGAWGNHVSVFVEPSFDAATTSVVVPGATAGATTVESCDGFDANVLVRVTQDAGGGLVRTEHHVIGAVRPSACVLEWTTPLATFDLTRPLRIEVETFTLSVRERGRLVEVWSRLSLVEGNPRFAPALLAGSALIAGAVPSGTPPQPASGNPVSPDWVMLAAGLDGTAALSLADLLGDELAGVGRGLAAFATVDEPAIVCVPDLVAEPVAARITVPPEVEVDPCVPCTPPPPPPDLLVADIAEASAAFDDGAVAIAQQALIDHCERHRDRIALLDPPCGRRVLDVPALTAWRRRFDSTFAALYAPWIVVLDPLASTPGRALPPWGELRRLPPSAHVAGLIAKVDAEVGAWQAPANRLLDWVHATDVAIGDAGHGVLNDAGVDVLRAVPSRGVAVLGARTVSSDTAWRYLSTRRLFLLLERTLRVGLAWTVFEPAGLQLQRTMGTAITGLLEDLWERGAFAGETPDTSFFVTLGGGDPTIGEVGVQIGIVVAPPAEVILLEVVRTADRLELNEQPQRSV